MKSCRLEGPWRTRPGWVKNFFKRMLILVFDTHLKLEVFPLFSSLCLMLRLWFFLEIILGWFFLLLHIEQFYAECWSFVYTFYERTIPQRFCFYFFTHLNTKWTTLLVVAVKNSRELEVNGWTPCMYVYLAAQRIYYYQKATTMYKS